MLLSLPQLWERIQGTNKTVVLCHGVFDIIHAGHIHLLEEAKSYGDILVVSLTPDKYVNKGPDRPIFSQDTRAKVVDALACVDHVVVNDAPNALDVLEIIRPDIYCKGEEVKSCPGLPIIEEREFVERYGGKLQFVEMLGGDNPISSSKVVNMLSQKPSDISFGQVDKYFDKIRNLRILVIGEYIQDEYLICEALARSSKEMLVPMKYTSKEMFAGGAAIVASNIYQFCDDVSLLTICDFDNMFLDMKIPERINLVKCDYPTIRKIRQVESGTKHKVSETVYADNGITQRCEDEIIEALLGLLSEADIVICADYGHGMFTRKIRELVEDKSDFLALTVQTNAANYGFNLVTRWNNSDYLVADEKEMRLATQNKRGPLGDVINEIAHQMAVPLVCVTLGHEGSMFRDSKGIFHVSPIAASVVDTMGAGDAFLAVTAPLAYLGISPEFIGLIGNAYGAMAVEIFGNNPVDVIEFKRFLRGLLA